MSSTAYMREYLTRPGKREAANERARAAKARRVDWVNKIKTLAPCPDCNQRWPACAMDFDHRPGEVKCFNVAEGLNRSVPAILGEMAKCDLVCSNCHRVRTAARGQ